MLQLNKIVVFCKFSCETKSAHLAKLSILETELNDVPASVAAFSRFFLQSFMFTYHNIQPIRTKQRH